MPLSIVKFSKKYTSMIWAIVHFADINDYYLLDTTKKYERIRFRIGLQYPFLCRTRGLKIDQSLGWDRKTRGHVSLQMWPDQDTPCSKAERRPKFCSPLSGMMTSPYGWKIFSELDIKNKQTTKQSYNITKKRTLFAKIGIWNFALNF